MEEQVQSLADTPYIGPRTFSEREQAIFFGRQREADDLRSLVLAEPVVLFYAQSGAGKSSLVNARLRPALRAAGFRVLPTTRVSGVLTADDMVSAANIFCLHLLVWLDETRHATRALYHQSLTDYLVAAGMITPPSRSVDSEQEDEREEVPNAPSTIPVLLVIDQFEELFTGHADKWEQRTAFFRQVRSVLQAAPQLHLLLVMREDFVASLDPYLRWLPGRLPARYGMERLGPEAAEEAIAGPVATSDRPFAPGVAGQLVENLRLIRVQGQITPQPGQYVEPVQLQVVCLQMWRNLQQRPPGPITSDDLQEAGDVDRALADYYEQSLRHVQERLPGIVSEVTLRDWFSRRLITENGTRGLVNQSETHTGGLSNVVVEVLDKERYLVRQESRAGGVWCELAHDRFVQPILDANRAWEARQNNPLAVVARLWLENERDPARLLSGQQLRDAQHFAAAQGSLLRQEEREFLTASAQAEAESVRQIEIKRLQTVTVAQRRRTRNLWIMVVVLTTSALLALSATAWTLQQRSEAIVARATAEAASTLAQENAYSAATAEAKAKSEADTALKAKSTAETASRKLQEEANSAATSEARAQRERNFAVAARATAESESNRANAALATQIVSLNNLLTAQALTSILPISTPTPPALITNDVVATRLAAATIAAKETQVAANIKENLKATATTSAIQTEVANLLATQTAVASAKNIVAPTASITSEQSVSITLPAATNTQSSMQGVWALIPDISLVLRKEPFEDAEQTESVRYPDKLAVIQIDSNLWIEVQSPSGETGWLYGLYVLYEGDKSQVPTRLRYQFINNRDDLPYVFGQIKAFDKADSIYLVADPFADPTEETNQLKALSIGTKVTLMLKSSGVNNFGSGIWYWVMYVDIDANSLLWGFLPEEILEPASTQ